MTDTRHNVLEGHSNPVLRFTSNFDISAAMSFARPFLLHPSPSGGEATAMAGVSHWMNSMLEVSSRDSDESAAALVYLQSASAYLEWLANLSGEELRAS